ncbi:hypothetical protein ANTRET_LOCUS9974 [Anthophora retusa]
MFNQLSARDVLCESIAPHVCTCENKNIIVQFSTHWKKKSYRFTVQNSVNLSFKKVNFIFNINFLQLTF